MNKAYKYRIYPTKEQIILIEKTFGCKRFIYNALLSDRISYYKTNKSMLKREVSFYKKNNKFLKEVDFLALANAKLDLDTAYKNFFTHKSWFPKFKKKGINESYTTNTVNNNIRLIDNKQIRLPKLGIVKIKQHRLIKDGEIIKNCTISKSANKYYISICVEYDETIPKKEVELNNVLGIDYSSKYLYVDSENNCADYPKYYRKSQKKLSRAQRKLSKMVKGSNNYKKQKVKLQKIHTKISNQRLDFLHKKSNEITNHYSLICFEDLNLRSMSKCLKLGKSTMDNGFGMFRDFITYKAYNKGGYTIKIDKWYPSTKTCFHCGFINKDITLQTIEWVCPSCGKHNLRDYNAALNIKKEGYRLFLEQ